MTPRPLRLAVLAPYPPALAPGQRFRFEQWLDLLPAGAVEATAFSTFSARAFSDLHRAGHHLAKVEASLRGLGRRLVDVAEARRFDVVYVHRELYPLGPPLLERFLEPRVPFVYDFDDAIYLPPAEGANRPAAWLRQPQKVGQVVAGATHTVVGNEFLAAFARGHSDRVSVIPTTVDVEAYRPPAPRPPGVTRWTIGWSGSFSTERHLHTVDGALRRVLTDRHFDLVVLGAPAYRLPGTDRVAALPWQRETEKDIVSSFDIGIMPLPDDPSTRGKCGFKALLYMALGVACIASPVGVNTTIIEHGVNGWLASTENEWAEAIVTLSQDEGLRRRLGAAGRDTVVERFSGQRWSKEFLRILEEAASTS